MTDETKNEERTLTPMEELEEENRHLMEENAGLRKRVLEVDRVNEMLGDHHRISAATSFLSGMISRANKPPNSKTMNSAIDLADRFITHFMDMLEDKARRYQKMMDEDELKQVAELIGREKAN